MYFKKKIGRFNLFNKTLLIPEMSRILTHLCAACLKSFGINAKALETCNEASLELGKEYTSGKECYPCQITMGDILYFLKKEKKKLKGNFDIEKYLYLMPETAGPCRFGMYNKYQHIVLNSFPEFAQLKIVSLSAGDAYSFDGMIEKKKVTAIRKASFIALVTADILDRLLMRIRPYENKTGAAEQFILKAQNILSKAFEKHAASGNFNFIFKKLEQIAENGKKLIDPSIPPKPLVGIVGEIYLRSHERSNQSLIKNLEKQGAEAVNASIAEWVNFTSYKELKNAEREVRLNLTSFKIKPIADSMKNVLKYGKIFFYQKYKQKRIYDRAIKFLNIAQDHNVKDLDNIIKERKLFTLDIGTEACLSIPGALSYAEHGFNGVVNVYPFTCMPSIITSAIVKPLMSKMRMPYLDASYDSTYQPSRETAIRTFMYQVKRHFKKQGRG